MTMRERRQPLIIVAALLAVLIITPFSSSYVIVLVTHALIFAILAMSLDILQEGLSILLVEQNAALALELVDYVHVISKGRVVYSAAPRELWANEEVKSSYLGM